MAINKVSVKGYVNEEPKFMMTERGPRMEIVIEIDRREEIGKIEFLTVITEKREIIARLLKDELHPGDFFVGDCVLHTFNYQKEQKFVCPHCHAQVVGLKKAEIMNVDIIDYNVFYVQLDYAHKGENAVVLRGTLIDNPKTRTVTSGTQTRTYTKFKLRVKRDNQPGGMVQENDYPFVVVFGNLAEETVSKLKKGDKVLITGSVQERTYFKVFDGMVCPECNYEVSPRINSYTREVIVRNIELLHTSGSPSYRKPNKIQAKQ